MIRSLIRRVFGRTRHAPRLYGFAEHHIHREDLSPLALKVCERLHQQGFAAFVVGGAVRDLLLGRRPKDFDVATNATPEEVQQVFRRARIIGRRFRIVHVMQGRDVVEVSTFRAAGLTAATDAHGRVLHDNEFGSQEEDALRRDFTANALYYDPKAEQIIDYQHGLEDIRARRLVLIGETETRFREDPVRMLRALRLSAKLDLQLAEEISTELPRLAPLLAGVPSARLLDELTKVIECGASWASLELMQASGVLPHFMPLLAVQLQNEAARRFMERALKNTDRRISEDKPVSVAFVFAALLWAEVRQHWQQGVRAGSKSWPALFAAIETVLEEGDSKLGIPRRHTAIMREIWSFQPRFEQRRGQKPYQLIEQERFRAAYDFLLLRGEGGEEVHELADWWTRFQIAGPEEQLAMQQESPKEEAPAKRRRRRRSSNAKKTTGDAA